MKRRFVQTSGHVEMTECGNDAACTRFRSSAASAIRIPN